jgi:hypothetical protein
MSVHVARHTVYRVSDITGRKFLSTSSPGITIKDASHFHEEDCVIPDPGLPGTSTIPNISTYLEAEEDSGYTLIHIDQSYVITSNNALGGGSGFNLTSTNSVISPVSSDTSEIELVWPDNATSLVLYAPDEDIELEASSGSSSTFTIKKGTYFSVTGRPGNVTYIARPNATKVNFAFIS